MDLPSTQEYIKGFSFVAWIVNPRGLILTGSFAGGAVSGTDYVGGLTGLNAGTLSNDYNLATVTGVGKSLDVGGLTGLNDKAVAEAYSTGKITDGTGSTDVGGLVGDNAGTIVGSYWDTGTSGITSSTGGIGGGAKSGVTGTTSAQLETQSFFPTTWNFTAGTGVWMINTSVNGGLASFQWQ